MLSRAADGALPVPLHRLMSGARAHAVPPSVDWHAPIDRSRCFLCETLTPLYYTRVYHQLDEAHQRRYNQLTGMLSNELILLLETEFLAASLAALAAEPDAGVRNAAARFAAEEQRHAETWRRLNRLSAPEYYGPGDRFLVRLPRAVAALSRAVARRPTLWPIVFWIQLSQEERSMEISRRCMRMAADRIEPRYAAAYREHLRDEARHVQIDCHLLDRYYAGRPLAVRRATAWALRRLLGTVFLRPTRSTLRVVDVLTMEHPELRSLRPRLVREVRALSSNGDYHRMMYSRETTPVTFAWFDRFAELHSMRRVLPAYEPRPIARPR